MLEVENLNITTINKYLIKDVSFKLNDGESLGIIGLSGSGKSTLAKALLNIYDEGVTKQKGTIKINNTIFMNEFRGKRISLVFQNPNSYLNPLMKVGKQISEMLIYHLGYQKKAAKEESLTMMNLMGINDAKTIYNYYPYQLSGGTNQKICLCIALICRPDIVILDESTSFLDNDVKIEILSNLKSLQKQYPFSLIIISHDFKIIWELCDKIAIMHNGEIIEYGNKNEIILEAKHPFTIKLLSIFLNFIDNTPLFDCSNEFTIDTPSIDYISETHFIKLNYNLPFHITHNILQIKEKVYEYLTNK